jgi:hypothetical protein
VSVPIQTDGFIVVGELRNEQRYPCLICRCIPEIVMVDLFIPEADEIPSILPLPATRQLVLPYRLCPKCAESKPPDRKIRLLMLERLNVMVDKDA